MYMETNTLWEEKSYTEQKKNLQNNIELEQNDSMKNTKNDLMNNTCKDIGKTNNLNVNWIKSWHYYWRYLKLIKYCKLHPPLSGTYVEKHHIIPKSMGGSNNENNIVKLIPRAHYLAHYMLWKAHKNKKMSYAFYIMNTALKNKSNISVRYFNGRLYEKISIEFKKLIKKRIVSLETRKRMSESHRNQMHQPKSAEIKLRISNSLSGRTLSEEHRKNISISNSGIKKKFSEETLHKFKTAIKKEKNPNYDFNKYEFYNEKLNLHRECTQHELRTEFNLRDSTLSWLIKGKYKTHKGWSVIK